MNILVTGANGFMGRNLCETLALDPSRTLYRVDVQTSPDELEKAVAEADFGGDVPIQRIQRLRADRMQHVLPLPRGRGNKVAHRAPHPYPLQAAS